MARTLHADSAVHHRPLPVADLDHGLGTGAVALGIIGLVLVIADAELAGLWIGLAGMVLGLWAQMISRTRLERFVDLSGLLLSFLAVATAFSQGAYFLR